MPRRASKSSSVKLPLQPAEPAVHSSAGATLAWWFAAAYALLVPIGFAVLRSPGAMIRGNEMSIERSIFTVVNAATLTGFQQSVAIDQYRPIGQGCILALTVAATFFTLIIGGLGLVRLLRLPISDRRLIGATIAAYVVLVAAGAVLMLEDARGLLASLFQSGGAFGNSGLYLGILPGATDWRTHIVLMPLALLGGLSVPVLIDLYDAALRRRRMSTHTRTVLALTAGAYLLGVVLLTPWWVKALSTAAAGGSVMSLNARTLGLPFASISMLPRVTQWLVIVFMLIGAAPAGTAGGLKVTSLFHLWRGARRALRREPGLRITGIAMVWSAAYLLLVLLTMLGMLATLRELPADRLLFLSVSAAGNVGLSHDPVSMAGPGLIVLSASMLLGRLLPLAVLWWAATTCEGVEVAVG
jgi:Trk-type K+ transport system membrane component